MTPDILESRLVLATGIAATGKSTSIYELSELLINSFILDKDVLNQSLLYIPVNSFPDLPSVEDYVSGLARAKDLAKLQTPMGEMYRMPHFSDYYFRHGSEQTYLIMAGIAAMNLSLGKTPLLDCMAVHRIQDGTVGGFLKQPAFGDFPRYLIHFVCEPRDCFDRMIERADADPEAAIRDQSKIASYDRFLSFLESEQPMMPPELTRYRHLIVNTSQLNPQESANLCLEYISSDENGKF